LLYRDGAHWADVVVFHIYGAGLARYWSTHRGLGTAGQYLCLAQPGEQEQLMQPHARVTARGMAVSPFRNAGTVGASP
jgi:hypothetical protein